MLAFRGDCGTFFQPALPHKEKDLVQRPLQGRNSDTLSLFFQQSHLQLFARSEERRVGKEC